jgi:diguanylate cyclase (GGDEF)-like protein
VLRIVSARGLPEDVVERAETKIGDGIAGHVASTARSLLIADLDLDSRFAGRNRERYYTNSLISSPLLRMGSVLGVVNVNNKRSRQSFVAEDLRLLDAMAGHAAVALGNARQYEETLQRSQCDALTGLANHGHLFARLDVEIERAERYGRDLSIAMIDIDHFKRFNDCFGHRAGDAALLAVANAVKEVSRVHDVVARYGGEEFTVVLPETDREGALAFGEKIRQSVESAGFGVNGREELTVSVGIAQWRPGNSSATALIEAADKQLYRAKFDGRNRVCAD